MNHADLRRSLRRRRRVRPGCTRQRPSQFWLRLAGLGSAEAPLGGSKRILMHFRHKFAPFWVPKWRGISCVFSPLSQFNSVQFNCLSICHSAICIIIIFVNYLASKIHENETLVSKSLSKDMKVMSYLSAQHLRCIIIKNWGDPFGQFGGGGAPWPLGG